MSSVSSVRVVTQQADIELRLLGELAIYRGGARVRLPQSKKTRALLAYLVLSGRPQRRPRLCSLLWDVADDPRAALRWSLSKLRPLVNDGDTKRIVTEGDKVGFDATGMSIDIANARTALAAGLDAVDTDTLIAVAENYRGELLEGLDMSDFDDFQAWCLAQREDARAMRARVLRALVARLESSPEKALPYMRTLVDIEPADEGVRAQLVAVLRAAGRDDEAQKQADLGERQLREFGVEATGLLAAARDESPAPPPRLSPPVPTTTTPVISDDTPMVGRQAERARVQEVLDRVTSSGRQHAVLISGEPGVGKTRLLVSLLDHVRSVGGTVLDGRSFEAERGRPFAPWIDALRNMSQTAAQAGMQSLAPLLLQDADDANPPTQSKMFDAAAQLFAHIAATAGPLVIALDDVQWIDASSAELLHYVARTNREVPLVLALTSRSGEIFDNEPMKQVLRSWRRQRWVDELEVGPLGREHTLQLVSQISSAVDGDTVFEQSAGLPLFALELARSGGAGAEDMSPTLAGVVRGRIERLSTEAVDVLRWVSVFGPSVSIDKLADVLALPLDCLMSALELAERHSLLRADGDGYAFSHDLVRHVVYDELSAPRRRLMHRKIAQSLQRAGQGDHAAEIAHHANLAGDAAMAARACVGAGRRSLRLLAPQDALALARRGARYAAQLADPERTTVSIDLWDIRLAAESPENTEQVSEELERLAETAIDLGETVHARLGFHLLGYLLWEGGSRNSDALRHMLHAEALTRGNDGPQRVEALAEAARCLVRLDRDLGHAQALLLEAKATAERTGVAPVALPAARGMLRAHEGAWDEAVADLELGQQRARHSQNPLHEFYALECLVVLELLRGGYARAKQLCVRLVGLGDKLRDGSECAYAHALSAIAAHACGAPDMREPIDDSIRQLEVIDAKHRLGLVLTLAARVDLEHGEAATALERAERGIGMLEIVRHRSDSAYARAVALRAASTCDHERASEHRDFLQALSKEGLASYARAAVEDVLRTQHVPRARGT